LTRAADRIDYIAVHNGYVPGLARDYDLDLRTVYRAMLAAPEQLRKSLDRVSAQIRKYAPEHASRIKIAVTEWSPSFQIALDGPYLDHPKTLGSALFVAANIKNYIEHPDVDIANYFKLNDHLWSGMIAPRNGKFIGTAPYYAFRMYRQHFGQDLVRTRTESPTYDSRGAGYVSAHQNVPYLDVVSSLSKNGKRLYVMVINKHFEQDISARIDISGFKAAAKGRAFILTGTGLDANTGTELFKAPGMKWPKQTADEKNPRFDKGGPGEIELSDHALQLVDNGFEYSFGKHSITAIELDLDGS
jgi:alpha-N-arabinofuranosidase